MLIEKELALDVKEKLSELIDIFDELYIMLGNKEKIKKLNVIQAKEMLNQILKFEL